MLRKLRDGVSLFKIYSTGRGGGVEAPVLWRRVAKYCGKAERKWKAKGWRIVFGGAGDDEFVQWCDVGG